MDGGASDCFRLYKGWGWDKGDLESEAHRKHYLRIGVGHFSGGGGSRVVVGCVGPVFSFLVFLYT